MKPSDIIESLELLISIKQPTFLVGDAGVGKSRLVRYVTEKMGLQLIDVRAVLLDPVDLRGLPHVNGDGRAHWAIPEFLPRDGSGVLFLDELNRAPQLVQNACLQLALDRKVGEYTLPDGWTVVAAGNPDTHRGVTRMSEALANRFEHLTVDVDVDDWVRWAIGADISPELIAFIRFRPALLHAYDAQATEKAYPSPRSWEFIDRLHKAKPNDRIALGLFAGAVGTGAGVEFFGFLDLYRKLPSLDAIIKNPTTAVVPDDLGPLFAISSALARKATVKNFAAIVTYIDRIPREWGAYCLKDATTRDATLCDTPSFINWAAKNADIMG